MVERLRSTYTIHATAANNCGYIVWFPGYCNRGGTGAYGANVFLWESNSTTANPTNTVAAPYGLGGTSASAIQDPAWSFCSRQLVQDSRGLAGCIQMAYTGQVSATQGVVAALENIPLTALIGGDVSGTARPVSVAQLMAYAAVKTRMPVDPVEVKWAPTDYGTAWHTTGIDAQNPNAGTADNCLTTGVAASAISYASGEPSVAGIRGIGFAWSGLNASTSSDFIVDFVKMFEWRPSPFSGLMEEPPIDTTRAKSTTAEEAVATVSHTLGNAWQFVVKNHETIGKVVSAMYGGTAISTGAMIPIGKIARRIGG